MDGRLTVECEAGNIKDLIKALSQVVEVFGAENECGCCHSHRLRPRYRDPQGNSYYELHCDDCGADFTFGQHKEKPTLFPKRSDDDGKPYPNHGWKIWQGHERD